MVLGTNVGILLIVTLDILNAPIPPLYFYVQLLHEFGQKGLYDTGYYYLK